jgi:hypothetical protein
MAPTAKGGVNGGLRKVVLDYGIISGIIFGPN